MKRWTVPGTEKGVNGIFLDQLVFVVVLAEGVVIYERFDKVGMDCRGCTEEL